MCSLPFSVVIELTTILYENYSDLALICKMSQSSRRSMTLSTFKDSISRENSKLRITVGILNCTSQVICDLSTWNALVTGNGSYILWPLVALTLGYDSFYPSQTSIIPSTSQWYNLQWTSNAFPSVFQLMYYKLLLFFPRRLY